MKTITTQTTSKKDILIRTLIAAGLILAVIGGYYAYLVRSGAIYS